MLFIVAVLCEDCEVTSEGGEINSGRHEHVVYVQELFRYVKERVAGSAHLGHILVVFFVR